ncbi:MAG: ferritin-like domain-containing protein [Oscillospiraceae bacterium]
MEELTFPCHHLSPEPVGGDGDVFARVWQRVMGDGDSPPIPTPPSVPVPPSVSVPPSVPVLPSVPAPIPTPVQPPAPVPVPETASLSPFPLGQLQDFLAHEVADEALYRALSRQRGGSRLLLSIAADEHRHAKRLSAAYFLATGVHYLPGCHGVPPHPCNHLGTLRAQYWSEHEGARAYRRAGEQCAEDHLSKLFAELADEEASHAQLILTLLERL